MSGYSTGGLWFGNPAPSRCACGQTYGLRWDARDQVTRCLVCGQRAERARTEAARREAQRANRTSR